MPPGKNLEKQIPGYVEAEQNEVFVRRTIAFMFVSGLVAAGIYLISIIP